MFADCCNCLPKHVSIPWQLNYWKMTKIKMRTVTFHNHEWYYQVVGCRHVVSSHVALRTEGHFLHTRKSKMPSMTTGMGGSDPFQVTPFNQQEWPISRPCPCWPRSCPLCKMSSDLLDLYSHSTARTLPPFPFGLTRCPGLLLHKPGFFSLYLYLPSINLRPRLRFLPHHREGIPQHTPHQLVLMVESPLEAPGTRHSQR